MCLGMSKHKSVGEIVYAEKVSVAKTVVYFSGPKTCSKHGPEHDPRPEALLQACLQALFQAYGPKQARLEINLGTAN